MNNNIVSIEYLKSSFKNFFILSVYWGIIYFIYSSTFNNEEVTLEHVLGAIEFISAITIVLIIILIICKVIGHIIIGLISALVILIIGCYYFDKFMTAYNISDSLINYFLLAIGVIFNIILLAKIIMNIRYYALEKQLQIAARKKGCYETDDL